MDYTKLTSGQRGVCASILVVMWGITFFLVAALAGLVAIVCCGLVFGYFGFKSDIFRDIAGVISGGVLFLSIMLLLRYEKRRGFILRSSVAIVQHFSHSHDHDA
jgi:ABC-type microcin C transport system permease subunit YejE